MEAVVSIWIPLLTKCSLLGERPLWAEFEILVNMYYRPKADVPGNTSDARVLYIS